MTIRLKQGASSQIIPVGPFVDSTDGDTELAGLTIVPGGIYLWKAGASSLTTKNESSNATGMTGGIYRITLNAVDTQNAGPLVIFIHPSGSLPVRVECEVLPANVYEALIAGTEWLETTSLRNDVTISGTTITVRKTDGSTTQYTKTGTFTAGADILTGLD